MKRYFIKLAYDGSDYFGWQSQLNEVNIQDEITKSIELICSTKDLKVFGCGRTDTGVHASKFYAHFDLDIPIIDVKKCIYKLNNYLPDSISIYDLFIVDQNAHARFDATQRTYHYYLHKEKNPFLNKYSLLFLRDLDFDLMNEAAGLLIDYRDFSAFSKLGSDNKSVICNVTEAKWEKIENQYRFSITSNRFLRNMVRAIVGTLLEVGLKKISISEFKSILESASRQNAGASAPAHALFLYDIKYPYISD